MVLRKSEGESSRYELWRLCGINCFLRLDYREFLETSIVDPIKAEFLNAEYVSEAIRRALPDIELRMVNTVTTNVSGNLTTSLQNLQESINNLTNTVGGVTQEINAVKEKLGTLEEKVVAVKEEVVTVKHMVHELSATFTRVRYLPLCLTMRSCLLWHINSSHGSGQHVSI